MFISIGSDGKVVVNDVTVIGWASITYASDRTIIDP